MRRRPFPARSRALRISKLRRLARLRHHLRRYLRFSESAARAAHITPQQYQLLLGIAGYTGRGWATVSELAEFLQERHNAVVGLVERAARRGLVRKEQGTRDRRFVQVSLTRRGEATIKKLAQLHLSELGGLRAAILAISKVRPRALRGAQRAFVE